MRQMGSAYTPVACTTPPVCFTGPGTCDPADGQCDYTPVVCNTQGVCQIGPGTCNPQNGQCSYPPLVCNANQCQVCQNSQCVSTCPLGTTCNGAGQCITDCVPGGICTTTANCCGTNVCCNGTCVTPDSECAECLSECSDDSSKCSCFHPDNGNYDCANRNGCDNGQGHYLHKLNPFGNAMTTRFAVMAPSESSLSAQGSQVGRIHSGRLFLSHRRHNLHGRQLSRSHAECHRIRHLDGTRSIELPRHRRLKVAGLSGLDFGRRDQADLCFQRVSLDRSG